MKKTTPTKNPGEIEKAQVTKNGITEAQAIERARLAEALNNIRKYGPVGRELSHIFRDNERENLNKLERQQQLNEEIRKKIDEGDFAAVENMIASIWRYELDSQTADKLCESGHSEMVRENTELFKSFGNVTYDKLKEKYDIYYILYTKKIIDKFEDHNHIVNDLITSKDIIKYYCNIKFKGLNNQTLKSLLSIKRNLFYEMDIDEDTFTGLDKEAFKMLLDCGSNNINESTYKFGRIMKKSFTGLDRDSFKYLLKSYDKIESYQYKAREYLRNAIIENIGIFSGLNKADAKNLIKSGLGLAVVKNLEVFKGLDKEIAKLLIEHGFGWDILDKLEKFGLKKEESPKEEPQKE